MKKSLTKPEILRTRREIQRVFRSSRIYRTNGLHLRIVANDLGWSRVLFATPRSMKGAVKRNRARRQVREIYRHAKEHIRPGVDMAFVLYPGDFSFQDRYEQVMTLLRRAEILLGEKEDSWNATRS